MTGLDRLRPRILLGLAAVVSAAVAISVSAAPLDEATPDSSPPESRAPKATSPNDIPNLEFVDPSDPTSPSRAAVEAFQRNDIEECLTQLRLAVAEDPSLPPPRLTLAGMYLRAGNREAARGLLEAAAAEKTKHPELRLALATLALGEGQLADAEAHLDKLDAFEPPQTWSEAQALRFRILLLTGRVEIAARRGNWGLANEYLESWVQLQPKQPQLRDRWAAALFMSGHESTAFEQFDIAHQQDPSINPPEVSMAAMHTQRREFEKADQWYAKAIKKFPDSAQVHFEWAVGQLLQDRPAEARVQAEAAAKLGLESVSLSRYRGIIERQLKSSRDAEQYLREALKQAPRDAEANYHLVLTLAEQGKPAQREAALKQAVEFAKQNAASPLAHAAVGAAQFHLGRYQEALDALHRGLATPAPDSEVLYFAARAAQELKKLDESQRIASVLRARIDTPGIFVSRAQAKQWLAAESSEK